jgi:hypothetical protein
MAIRLELNMRTAQPLLGSPVAGPPRTWEFLVNSSLYRVAVKCQDLCQFLDTKRPDGNRKAVKETTNVFSVILVDILQHAFVGLVQGLR